MPDEFAGRIAALFPAVRADLESLVRIPSVSAEGPDTPAMRACLERVGALLAAEGLTTRRLEVPDAPPVLLAERPARDGAPTVLLYAHYDVQPPGPTSEWARAPFEPREQDGRLYGRGASDDKGGIAIHLGALRALGEDVPVGVKVIVEGEEELGSPHMRAVLEQYGDLLAADVIVVADSEHWRVGAPAITTTQRGLADCIVEVRTLANAVHSGQFGGAIPDALSALARLLASLHDDEGNVALDGLVHGAGSSVDVPEDDVRATAEVASSVALIGSGPISDRLWTRPAISVLAIDAPRVAEAINQLVPVARAKVSLRLAPDQDPERARDILVRHLETHAPWGAQVTVTPGAAAPGFSVRQRGPIFEAFAAGMQEAWGVAAAEIGIGGSIPLVSALADRFPDAVILVTGVGDPTSRIHGPNESQNLSELERSMLAEALALRALAAMAR